MLVNRLILFCLLAGVCCTGQEPTHPILWRNWSAHFQATSIGQQHGSFPSLYEGDNSLPPHSEFRASVTATAFVSLRLNPHCEFVVNPEIAGGRGFGGVTGIAGFTNGEIPRVAAATPTLYLARGYVRFSIPLGNRMVETAAPAAPVPATELTLITGKFALTDFFDNNKYSHDPRSQFMNWSLMSNGAWDYPADTRGYTVGAFQEFRTGAWSVRTAAVMEPTTANGGTLDTRVGVNRGVVLESERRYAFAGHGGAARVLVFENLERAGTFRKAMRGAGQLPDLDSTRRNGTKKYGGGLNVEQEVADGIGVFARYGWSDGKTETWAFTEIDRSLSGGVSINGRRWRRKLDTIGVGAVRNFLSGDHRSFLAAGGLGFIIGDGRLNYRPEQIIEAYYALHVSRSWTVTGDFQRVANPAYNRDRGPVSVATVRLHWEM